MALTNQYPNQIAKDCGGIHALDQSIVEEPSCPVGIQDCPIIAQLSETRKECSDLGKLLHTDPLTGLFNYRYFMMALDREMERTRRTGHPTGLIMIDLDHFKRINDTFGHPGGNQALQWASSIWRENLRRIDITCRYGGEEFAIILPGTRMPKVILVAERLRAALDNSAFTLDGQAVNLTASFGAALYDTNDDISFEQFIKKADDLLLEAKSKGRNRVCHGEATPSGKTLGVNGEERIALFITRWSQK